MAGVSWRVAPSCSEKLLPRLTPVITTTPGGTSLTVTCEVSFSVFTVTVMSVLPAFRPVTTPLEVTEAMVVLADL